MDITQDYESCIEGSNPSAPILEVDYIARCSYFKCIKCNELISLNYPETYKEAKRYYEIIRKKHIHES